MKNAQLGQGHEADANNADWEKVKNEALDHLDYLDSRAKEDAEAIFAAIVSPSDDPEIAVYQLLLLNERIKERINFYSLIEFVQIVDKNNQSNRAFKRHAENRAMREEVFQWLDSNMSRFKTMDKAASAIENKVVPIEWRTARDWVGQWKKLRSAGTP